MRQTGGRRRTSKTRKFAMRLVRTVDRIIKAERFYCSARRIGLSTSFFDEKLQSCRSTEKRERFPVLL